MRTTPTLPPTHRLTRATLAATGVLVVTIAATIFASSPLPGQLWHGCSSFVDNVRGLW